MTIDANYASEFVCRPFPGAVIDALHPAQQRLAREINPKVFSTHEWKMKLTVPDPFVSDVLSNKKIFLIGDEYGLAELGRHKS